MSSKERQSKEEIVEQLDGIGEAMHVYWRKYSDCPQSAAIHVLINEMKPQDWMDFVAYVKDTVGDFLTEKG